MHAGMSYERLEALGGIQWPCPDESHPGTQFLHARLWEFDDPAAQGTKAPFSVVIDEPPVDGWMPSSRSGSPRVAGWTRTTPACRAAATRRRCAVRNRSRCRRRTRRCSGSRRASGCSVTSRRGAVEAPVHVDHGLRPGLMFMTLHFPDQVETNTPHDRGERPEVRDGRVQGDRGADREAGAGARDVGATGTPSEGSVVDLHLTSAAASDRGARGRRRAPRVRRRPGGSVGSARPASRRRFARGGRRRPGAAGPVASRAARAAVRRRMDQRGRPELHLPATDRASGRGVRRRDVLRDVQRRTAAEDGRARLRRPRLPIWKAIALCTELEASFGPPGPSVRGRHGHVGAEPVPGDV